MSLEDYLHKIDMLMQEKTKKEIYMVYAMIIALIFAFSYLLFWESSQNKLAKKIDEVKILKSQINQNQTYLHNHPDSSLVDLDTRIKNLQKELIKYKDSNRYIREKLKMISSHLYNANSWGKYLDSISQNAQNSDVRLLTFTNNFVSSKHSFGHILDVSLRCEGNYQNILKFINVLEQNELITDLHTINMETNGKLNADLNLSVWGISYE